MEIDSDLLIIDGNGSLDWGITLNTEIGRNWLFLRIYLTLAPALPGGWARGHLPRLSYQMGYPRIAAPRRKPGFNGLLRRVVGEHIGLETIILFCHVIVVPCRRAGRNCESIIPARRDRATDISFPRMGADHLPITDAGDILASVESACRGRWSDSCPITNAADRSLRLGTV